MSERYSGKEELFNIESYLPNYNRSIVDYCKKYFNKKYSLLDFGSGIGTLPSIFKDLYGVSAVCVELDEDNRDKLSSRGYQVFKNIEEVEIKVDFIFSSNVLEHIEDDSETLRKLNASLKDNGLIYLYLPANMLLWTELDEEVGHYRRYSKKEILMKLNKTGFKVVKINYADSLGFFAALLTKYIGYDGEKGVGSPKTLRFYDKYIFPISRILDNLGLRFFLGKNIYVVAVKSK